jgi:hypothetical protein
MKIISIKGNPALKIYVFLRHYGNKKTTKNLEADSEGTQRNIPKGDQNPRKHHDNRD